MASSHIRPPLPAGPYLILGLGRSGVAAALSLRARGERVVGLDSGEPRDLSRLYEAGVEVRLDASADASAAAGQARTLVKSPGVPQNAAVLAAARARGVEILGELELAWRLLPNEFVAVTGTNGKTTTTEWIAHILREAALPVAVAGNVGTAATSLVGEVRSETTIVCEASSFQLEDSSAFAPDAAVLLNLSPDHLDRHGSYEQYVAAKLRIFANQTEADVAVAPLDIGIEDLGGCARVVLFGHGQGAEVSYRAGQIWWDEQALIAAEEVALPGEHNRQNAMAAAAVTLARGVDPSAVRQGLRSFAGVPHRLELVGEHGGVRFVNDSKATNVASTIVALRSLEAGVHLIAGGRGKGQDFAPLTPLVRERCAAVYLIGEAAVELSQILTAAGVRVHEVVDMERAVGQARRAARPGETVLLSPACASYDQYADFEARGDHFRHLVEEL